MKKVSVIIPCHNVTKYIGYCLDSLIRQTIGFENIEVILINDASTDGTLGKLMQYEFKYPDNIVIIPLEEKVMQGAARNIGLQYATGEYVNYLDSDDYIHDTAYEKLYRLARQNDADFIEYGFNFVPFHNVINTDIRGEEKDFIKTVNTVQDRKELAMAGLVSRGCWNKFYKRELVVENNLRYAEGVYDEESLFTVMATYVCHRYMKIGDKFYYYFQNPEGTCYNHVHDLRRRDDNAKVWYELLLDMKDRGMLETYSDEFGMMFVQNYLMRSITYSISRHLDIDLETINIMQKTVHEYFPDIQNNPYVLREPGLSQTRKYFGIEINEGNLDDFVKWMCIEDDTFDIKSANEDKVKACDDKD